MDFTIGCDPEIFVKDKTTGKAVSAHGLIEGTKEAPFKVNGGAYQVDGMAVEFNTDPIVMDTSSAVFSQNVLRVMDRLKADVQASNKELTFDFSATADFDKDYLDSQPDEAKELGCDPDFNAYTLEQNSPPDAENVLFRTAAGHVHVGWTSGAPTDHPDHLEICANAVKALDASVGLVSLIYEPDNRRRELYGKAGAFRPKEYGVEYRTPSNFWIVNHEHRRAMFLTVKRTMNNLMRYRGDVDACVKYMTSETPDNIRSIIDNNEIGIAKRILSMRCIASLEGKWRSDAALGWE